MSCNVLLIALGALCPLLAIAQSRNTPARELEKPVSAYFRTLPPADVEAVQGLGRAVLGAKRGYALSPEQAALRLELKALSAEIDSAFITVANRTAPRLQIEGGKETANTQVDARQQDQSMRSVSSSSEDSLSKLRARASSLGGRRTRLADEAAKSGDEEKRGRSEGMGAKVDILIGELQTALDAPDREKWAKLGALRKRLSPQSADASYRELGSNQPGDPAVRTLVEPTPTISTIIRHR